MSNNAPNTELSSEDIYFQIREDCDEIAFHYFENYARVYPEKKKIVINVTCMHEYFSMWFSIDAYLREEAQRQGVSIEEIRQRRIRATEQDIRRRHNEIIKTRYTKNYNIDFDAFLRTEHFEREEEEHVSDEPFINAFSGSQITLHYGEGLLDFIYADFSLPYAYDKVAEERRIKQKASRQNNTSDRYRKSKPDDPYEQMALLFLEFEAVFRKYSLMSYASLYSAICPPQLLEKNDNLMELSVYYLHLTELQKEFLQLVEFCFDYSFYPEILGHLHPSERYSLFKKSRLYSAVIKRQQRVSFDEKEADGEKPPFGLPQDEIENRLSTPIKRTKAHRELAKYLNISVEKLIDQLQHPQFEKIEYAFSSVQEILELEFSMLLETNARFRKCKRCGKYFVMKGNYDTNYCDRIASGETKTCQELAATENYKAKHADDQALSIYNKYYKRYAARMKVKQIKGEAFKQWKYQAMTKRDECNAGAITPEEYIQWMEDYFPNRKPKQDK